MTSAPATDAPTSPETGHPDRTEAERAVRAYHERTKHHLQRFAAGPDTLDWDAQPHPFRRWEGAPLTLLPLQADGCTVSWTELFQAGAVAAQPFSVSSLALLFELSLALAAWKQYGPDRWALRCNPSSGNLHPTEGWLVARDVPGVPDGVHHYAPYEHLLEHRAAARPVADASDADGPRVWLGLSSVLWREAWKYGERAFRYCQIDAGHAVGALRYAAAVLGWRLDPVALGTEALAALLGLDRDGDFGPAEREEPEVLLELRPAGAPPRPGLKAPALPPDVVWRGRPNRLDRHPMYRWPVIDTVAQASRQPHRSEELPSDAASAGANADAVGSAAKEGAQAHDRAADLIRRRRSAQHFDRRARAPLAQVLGLLSALQPGRLPLDAGPTCPRVHVVVFAHRVDGLEPGAYLLPRRDDALPDLHAQLGPVAEWMACDDVDAAARAAGLGPLPLIRLAANPALAGTLRTLDCHQALGSDAILAFSLLGEYDTALAEGPWGYRELLQEAGLVGQVLYMEAEAAGLSGTGIGCYFDDATHQLLGLTGTGLQALYHFTVGLALRDERIASEPPYAHLTQARATRQRLSEASESCTRPVKTPPSPADAVTPSTVDTPGDASTMTDAPSRAWTRLTAEEVPAHLAQHPDTLILDARDERAHAAGHLPGSLRLDGRNHERLLMRGDRQRPVFIYCYHGNASQTYAQMFADFGYAQVSDLIGGWAAWSQSGAALPSSTDSAPAAPTTAAAPDRTRSTSEALAAWLLQEGFDTPDPSRPGPHGNTPLMHAAWRGQHHLLHELLDLGVPLDAINGDGNNALWLACVNGEPGLLRALAARGVPIDHQNAVGATCLMYAASAGKDEVVRTLLALGANPHLTSQDDFSALDMAATVECLQLLRAATRTPRAA